MKVINHYIVSEEDLDLFHHMNYKVYIERFEKERSKWFQAINYSFQQMAEDKVGVVIIKLETDYIKEARGGDQLTIETFPGKIGNSSLSLEQTMLNDRGEVIAKSFCLLVMFDLVERKSIPVLEKIARHFT